MMSTFLRINRLEVIVVESLKKLSAINHVHWPEFSELTPQSGHIGISLRQTERVLW